MESKDRLTAQGIRDLNYYGPRKARVAEVATVADDAPPAAPPVVAPMTTGETTVPVTGAE